MPQRLRRLQNISGDADGDTLGGFPHRITCEMRIARGGLDAAETEQPADDWQALAVRKCPRGEGMSEVVNSPLFQPGAPTDARPRMLKADRC